ncbi:MAG: hypothetical protein U0841_13840 [Chloroflexia bacterium]
MGRAVLVGAGVSVGRTVAVAVGAMLAVALAVALAVGAALVTVLVGACVATATVKGICGCSGWRGRGG